jgi:hypothetical protein
MVTDWQGLLIAVACVLGIAMSMAALIGGLACWGARRIQREIERRDFYGD